jgi:hypothetical protein
MLNIKIIIIILSIILFVYFYIFNKKKKKTEIFETDTLLFIIDQGLWYEDDASKTNYFARTIAPYHWLNINNPGLWTIYGPYNDKLIQIDVPSMAYDITLWNNWALSIAKKYGFDTFAYKDGNGVYFGNYNSEFYSSNGTYYNYKYNKIGRYYNDESYPFGLNGIYKVYTVTPQLPVYQLVDQGCWWNKIYYQTEQSLSQLISPSSIDMSSTSLQYIYGFSINKNTGIESFIPVTIPITLNLNSSINDWNNWAYDFALKYGFQYFGYYQGKYLYFGKKFNNYMYHTLYLNGQDFNSSYKKEGPCSDTCNTFGNIDAFHVFEVVNMGNS